MPRKACSPLRCVLVACIFGAVAFTGGSGLSEVSEKPISLNFRDKPLREVLQRLAGETGFTFLFDDAWGSHRVSVALEKVPMQAGLRRILGSLNYALVYLPNRTVKILILEKGSPQSSDSSRAPAHRRIAPTAAPAPEPPHKAPVAQEPEPPPQEQPPAEEAPASDSQPVSN